MHLHLILIIHKFRICESTCSLKFICNYKIYTHSVFTVFHRYAQNTEKLVTWNLSCSIPAFPSEVEQRHALPSLSSYSKQILLIVYLVPFFKKKKTFLCLLLVISLFKGAPSIPLKCYLGFLNTRRLWCTLRRKYVYWISFLQTWVIVLLALNSMIRINKMYWVPCL